jgi:hypothetical protein
MKLMSLRELVELFDTRQQQLTVGNLVKGFFPAHTLLVSLSSTVVCAALALGTRQSPASAAEPVFFRSVSAFCAICTVALMTTTLLYRLTGGRFVFSTRSTGEVVDWLVDGISRPIAEDIGAVLLDPGKRRERVIFFIGLCVVAEVGKVLSFWPMCTLTSIVWVGYSVRLFCAQQCTG